MGVSGAPPPPVIGLAPGPCPTRCAASSGLGPVLGEEGCDGTRLRLFCAGGGYVALRRSTSLKARDGSPAQGCRRCGGGRPFARAKRGPTPGVSPAAPRSLRHGQRRGASHVWGTGPVRDPPLASQTSGNGGGGGPARRRRPHRRRRLPHPHSSTPKQTQPSSKKKRIFSDFLPPEGPGPAPARGPGGAARAGAQRAIETLIAQ